MYNVSVVKFFCLKYELCSYIYTTFNSYTWFHIHSQSTSFSLWPQQLFQNSDINEYNSTLTLTWYFPTSFFQSSISNRDLYGGLCGGSNALRAIRKLATVVSCAEYITILWSGFLTPSCLSIMSFIICFIKGPAKQKKNSTFYSCIS